MPRDSVYQSTQGPTGRRSSLRTSLRSDNADEFFNGVEIDSNYVRYTGIDDIGAANVFSEFTRKLKMLHPRIVKNPEKSKTTLEWYSRFYGRACRDYCLSMCAVGGLVISGGIAAKNPSLVHTDVFLEEFWNRRSSVDILRRIPILLNRREDIGLLGSACVGLGVDTLREAQTGVFD